MGIIDILNFNNLDLLLYGVTIAAIAILGFIVYLNDRTSATTKSFFVMSLVAIAYSGVNYWSYHTTSPTLVLWLLRFVLFFAVWYSILLYHLTVVFPTSTIQLSKKYKYGLLPVMAIVSLIALSPFTLIRIDEIAPIGEVTNPVRGWGIMLFGLATAYLVVASLITLFKKTRNATGSQHRQFVLVLIGVVITYTFFIVFNMVLPVAFNVLTFIPLAPFFTLPFIVFTGYAIIKHHLFDIKVIATEMLTFALAVVTLFEVGVSKELVTTIFRIIVFMLTLGIGYLLIKSVRKEVKQREELQVLTKKLEEANEQLKALDKARSDFITIASHQLRTPPATIKWYLGSILSGDYGPLDQGVKTELEKAQVTNNSLISLIDDMLNASRIERGKMEFLFEEVDLEQLTKLTYDQMVPLAGMKKLGLTYEQPANPIPHVMADREKIRQVVNNFIDNAIKYTKSGSVSVAVVVKNEAVEVRVTDTGKGLSEIEQKNLFTKYTRGKDAMTHSSGLGLGLYVAKIIVEQHKGKIWAESPGEGKGSTFAFSIPLHADLPENSVLNLALPNNPPK